MRTNIEAIDYLFKYLKPMGLPTFKMAKPAGTEKEYIVINAMPITGDTLMKCYANVNIHVKDIIIKDQPSLPDSKRLGELASIYTEALELIIAENMHIYYDRQGIEREDTLNEHYVNIRLLCNLIDK
jgi:hypothetical protein